MLQGFRGDDFDEVVRFFGWGFCISALRKAPPPPQKITLFLKARSSILNREVQTRLQGVHLNQ